MWRPCWALRMNEIVLSDAAKHDLLGIRDYIANELENPDAALRIVASITACLRKLQEYAHLGRTLSAAIRLETSYRYLVCGKYHAFYRCGEGVVYVDRILYFRQDFMRALFGIEQQ